MQLFHNVSYDWNLLNQNIQLAHQKYLESFNLLPELTEKISQRLNVPINFDPLMLIKAFSQVTLDATNSEKLLAFIQMMKSFSSLANPMAAINNFGKNEIKDKRFKDDEWSTNPFFKIIKDYYFQSSQLIEGVVSAMPCANSKDQQKISFYTKQFLDAVAPVNFPFLNPEVIRETFNSYGQNLINGAANFLQDIQDGIKEGKFSIATTDSQGFSLGENLAITPGKVIFQNELFQLIQYEASTKEVFKTPLLVIPAWINKYYILDLQAHNSLVKWLVDQGHSVFMVSWTNPTAEFADKSFEDYMLRGVLKAIEQVQEATKSQKINCMGYCLGGTMLAATLAYLAKQNKLHEYVSSATFLTTLVDFQEVGDVGVFIDEQQLTALDNIMKQNGYLDGYYMALCFSILRASDMIWSYYINNYLLGKKPQAFDILHWNSDSTRMPYTMHLYYLRKLYLENLLVKADGLTINGVGIDLAKIDIPTYILATKDDHIAPWKSVYLASNIYNGNNCFVLGGSGHVAGIVNPPNKNKYSYRTNNAHYLDPQEWFNTSKEIVGSWWPHWLEWSAKQNSDKIPSRIVDKKSILEAAPGSYVKLR